jgi:uroporphyrinogen III methyltransferase/synthase
MTSGDRNSVENAAAGILSGRNILVTRPRDQAGSLAELLSIQGAKVLLQPVIEILPIQDWAHVDAAIKGIGEFGWLTFVSVNGVRYFLDRCTELSVDLENQFQNSNCKIAAIGQRTAFELENRGLSVSLIPSSSDSHGVAESLMDQVKTEKVLLVRADRGSEELSARLQQEGISHEEIAVYRSSNVTSVDPEIIRRMKQHEIDWVTVTSSAVAQSIVNLFGEFLGHTKLASISPTTSKRLRDLKFPPAAEATEFNMPGLVQAIVEFERKR